MIGGKPFLDRDLVVSRCVVNQSKFAQQQRFAKVLKLSHHKLPAFPLPLTDGAIHGFGY
jgi:hypothetical protein